MRRVIEKKGYIMIKKRTGVVKPKCWKCEREGHKKEECGEWNKNY